MESEPIGGIPIGSLFCVYPRLWYETIAATFIATA